jgi:hypothetical protein
MRSTPGQPRATRRDRSEERLKTLAALIDAAQERLDEGSGFFASVDPEAIEAYRASGLPEVIGAGPTRKPAG